jgi:hypothetical protein
VAPDAIQQSLALGSASRRRNGFQGFLQVATLETSVTSYLTTEYGASFGRRLSYRILLLEKAR